MRRDAAALEAFLARDTDATPASRLPAELGDAYARLDCVLRRLTAAAPELQPRGIVIVTSPARIAALVHLVATLNGREDAPDAAVLRMEAFWKRYLE